MQSHVCAISDLVNKVFSDFLSSFDWMIREIDKSSAMNLWRTWREKSVLASRQHDWWENFELKRELRKWKGATKAWGVCIWWYSRTPCITDSHITLIQKSSNTTIEFHSCEIASPARRLIRLRPVGILRLEGFSNIYRKQIPWERWN